jgi:hypothetical protein
MALRNTLPDFLSVLAPANTLTKFIRERSDPQRSECFRIAA